MSGEKSKQGNRLSAQQRRSRARLGKNKTASSRPGRTGKQANSKRFRHEFVPILILVLVTLTAYLNAWTDNLVLDDKVFAASGRYADIGLSGFMHFFTEDLWAASGSSSGLYRPLLLVTIATDAYVYGDWMPGYHLSNILLHLLVTVLVFGFIRHLLLASGGQAPLSASIALLSALVYGVHPINTEVVNSIFNRSDALVAVGVIGGLWWFLRNLESSSFKAWGGLALCYLLVLFCKESSAVLPALAVALLWIFTPGTWRVHLRKSLPVLVLLIPLGIFLTLRANALESPSLPEATSAQSQSKELSVSSLPDTRELIEKKEPDSADTVQLDFDIGRILPASVTWLQSFKKLLWPHPLEIYSRLISIRGDVALALQLVLLGFAIMGLRKKRYGLIAGLAFFYIAILPASRLIAEPGIVPHVAERYLYLPSVGLVITLAFSLRWLALRFNFRAAMTPVLLALMMLTPLTWARNAQWASDVLLYESNYGEHKPNEYILPLLVGAHLREKNFSRATEICDQHTAELEKGHSFSHRCAFSFGMSGRVEDAERAFMIATRDKKIAASAYAGLAGMYLDLGRKSDAQMQFELAIEKERNPAMQEYRQAEMLSKLYPSDRTHLLKAKGHLEQALKIQPQLVMARQMLERLNRILGLG